MVSAVLTAALLAASCGAALSDLTPFELSGPVLAKAQSAHQVWEQTVGLYPNGAALRAEAGLIFAELLRQRDPFVPVVVTWCVTNAPKDGGMI